MSDFIERIKEGDIFISLKTISDALAWAFAQWVKENGETENVKFPKSNKITIELAWGLNALQAYVPALHGEVTKNIKRDLEQFSMIFDLEGVKRHNSIQPTFIDHRLDGYIRKDDQLLKTLASILMKQIKRPFVIKTENFVAFVIKGKRGSKKRHVFIREIGHGDVIQFLRGNIDYQYAKDQLHQGGMINIQLKELQSLLKRGIVDEY